MNKNFLKIICFINIIILLFTSCSSIRRYKEPSEYSLPSDYKSPSKYKEIANEHMENIITAIENKDKNALKNLFSKKAIDTNNFDDNISDLFEFYKNGKTTSIDNKDYRVSDEGILDGDQEHKWEIITASYDVEIDYVVYRFALKIFLNDNIYLDNIGVSSLYVIKGENTDLRFDYWGDGMWTLGINVVKEKFNNNINNN